MDRKAQKGAQEAGQEDVVVILPASKRCRGTQNSDSNQMWKETERKEMRGGEKKEEGREEGAGTQNKTVSVPLVSAGQLICTDPKWGNTNHSYLWIFT